MSILRKRGKEKLRFRIMDRRVTNKDFRYFKRLFLECLKENGDIEKQLDFYYRRIQVLFFYEQTDPQVEKSVKEFLKDPEWSHHPTSRPALAVSREGLGCIPFFIKHMREYTKRRDDIEKHESYHKNGIFEELCHLVEQKGDSNLHPASYGRLWNIYRNSGKLEHGNQILAQLDTDRNHYEVYLMVMTSYPKEWTERYCRYFMEVNPEEYKQKYEQWKKNIPSDIVYARLIVDTLRTIGVLHVAEKVPLEKLSDNQKELLDTVIRTGKLDFEKKRSLIEKDMGIGALILVDSLDEGIFKTSEIFFSIILDLWKSLHLV